MNDDDDENEDWHIAAMNELQALCDGWEAHILAKGRKGMLLKLLTLKFGTLSVTDFERARTAPNDEVERWAERVLTASTLEAVFTES